MYIERRATKRPRSRLPLVVDNPSPVYLIYRFLFSTKQAYKPLFLLSARLLYYLLYA